MENSDNEFDDYNAEPIGFPTLETQITEIINDYEAVVPKLNWSSPRDAMWINPGNSLKCTTIEDIFILLKSSDSIAHDLMAPFGVDISINESVEYELVLKRWFQINPAHEFRCFVHNRRLLAIVQRDRAYYPFLNSEKSQIQDQIVQFFNSIVLSRFTELADFVFDVYLSSNLDRVWLMDIQPFSNVTDPVLLDWDYVDTLASNTEELQPIFRTVEQEEAGKICDVGSVNRVPHDFVEGGQDIRDYIQALA